MPRKPKDLLSQSTIVVSERDRQIYHEVMIVGRSQRAVAAKFGLSQQRISKIVNRTSVWMSETAPYGLAEVPRPQRLYQVARVYKQKLDWYENEAKEEWLKSKADEQWTSTHDLTPGPDGKQVIGDGKMTRKKPKADTKYLALGQKFAEKRTRFEGFDEDGSVARNNDDRLHEVPIILPDEELDEMISIGERAKQMKQQQQLQAEAAGLSKRKSAERVASATAAPSPLYSGERVGVRGEAGTDSDRSHDSPSTAHEVCSTAKSVPAPAPHPNPLPVSRGVPQVPRRGDPKEALSEESPEVGLEREIAGPNDFHNGLLPPTVATETSVARRATESSPGRQPWEMESRETSARRATEVSPPEPLSPLPGLDVSRAPDSQGSRPGLLSTALRAKTEPPPKVYPPTPEGYYRHGDRCRPKMTRRDAIPCTKLLPVVSKKPAKWYDLSPDGKEWWPQS